MSYLCYAARQRACRAKLCPLATTPARHQALIAVAQLAGGDYDVNGAERVGDILALGAVRCLLKGREVRLRGRCAIERASPRPSRSPTQSFARGAPSDWARPQWSALSAVRPACSCSLNGRGAGGLGRARVAAARAGGGAQATAGRPHQVHRRVGQWRLACEALAPLSHG